MTDGSRHEGMSSKPIRITVSGLTPGETEVVGWVTRGLTNKSIASQLHVSSRTVHDMLRVPCVLSKSRDGNLSCRLLGDRLNLRRNGDKETAMGTARKIISSQLRTWQHSARTLTLLGMCFSLLVGCSTGENNSEPGNNGHARNGTAGTATLLPSVKVINSTQADYVTSQTATTWTLRTGSSVHPGDVLLLEDEAVKVVSVDTSSEQTVLTVTPAQIQDVFSQLSLKQSLDLTNARFTPDPSGTIPAALGPPTVDTASLAAISATDTLSLKIPYNKPPWTASLEFKLVGKVDLDYDNSNDNGITGTLDVTGIAQGEAAFGGEGTILFDLREIPLGKLYFPIPLSVVDSLFNVVGIRVASIQVPLFIGAKAKTDIAFQVGVKGFAQTQLITRYDATSGFSVSGPTLTGTLKLNGLPSETVPTAPATATVMVGPYVHARPQLLILGKVASIGADVTVGLYGKGEIKSIVFPPFYCLNLTPVVGSDASGFFKGYIPNANMQTSWGPYPDPPVNNELTIGSPFLYPASVGESGCSSIRFSKSTYTVSQTDRTASINVSRTGDPSAPVTVQYATSNGTAVAGQDYTAVSGTLTFNPMDTAKTFTIPILNNPTNQGGTVNLTLSQPSAGTELGTPSTAVLTIASGISGTWKGPFSLKHAVECSWHDQGTLSMTILQNGTNFSGSWSRNWPTIVVGPAFCEDRGSPNGTPNTSSGGVSGTLTTAGDVTTLIGTFTLCEACGGENTPVTESWTATLGVDLRTMTGKWDSMSYSNVGTSSFTLTKQ